MTLVVGVAGAGLGVVGAVGCCCGAGLGLGAGAEVVWFMDGVFLFPTGGVYAAGGGGGRSDVPALGGEGIGETTLGVRVGIA